MTLSGVTTATNAGDYTAVFTLNAGFQWTDGTEEPKNVQWSIQRATPTITVDTSNISVRKRYDSAARTFQLVQGENTTFSITSADSDIATGTVDSTNNTFTVHGAGYGDTTLRLTTAQTANYAAANIPIEVTVTGQPDIYTTCLFMGEELPVTDEITGVQCSQPSGYDVSIDTSVKKFGKGSILTPTYYHYAQFYPFSLGGQDFTIDWWEYKGDYTASSTGRTQTGKFWVKSNSNNQYIIHTVKYGDTTHFYFSSYLGSGTTIQNVVPSYQWNHFAAVYKHSASNLYFFINGVLKVTHSGTIPRIENCILRMGHGPGSDLDSYASPADNYWDNVRVSDGIARWTSNFTPPTINDY